MTPRKQIRFLRANTEDDCIETIYSGVGLSFAAGYLADVTLPEEMEGDFDDFDSGVLINCDWTDHEGCGPRTTPAPKFAAGLDISDKYFSELPHHLKGDLWEYVEG